MSEERNPLTRTFTVYPSNDGTFVIHFTDQPHLMAERIGLSSATHLVKWVIHHANGLKELPPWAERDGVVASMMEPQS